MADATDPRSERTEAVGVFEDAKALRAAVDELLESGFDHAEISVMAGENTVEEKLGNHFRRVEQAEDDPSVPRQAFVSDAAVGDAEGGLIGGLAYVGAVAAAGAVVATGGALAGVVAAAVAAGGAGGLLGSGLAKLIDERHAKFFEEQIDRGGILLWVRTRSERLERRAKEILEKHSAHDVHTHSLPSSGG